MPLGIVMVPDPQWSKRLVVVAGEVVEGCGDVMSVLGEGRLPHVSIAHVDGDMDPAVAWDELGPLVSGEWSLKGLGYRFHPYPSAYGAAPETAGGSVAFLQVLYDNGFRTLRERVTSSHWYGSGTVTYPLNDAVDPHFTLGVTTPESGFQVRGPVPLDDDVIGRTMPARVALGPIGAHGVFEEVLFGGW